MYNCYIHNYDKHKVHGVSLHDTSVKINEIVNKSHRGQQISEILNRLTYNVYIEPNVDRDDMKNDDEFEMVQVPRKLMTRYELIMKNDELVERIGNMQRAMEKLR